MNYSSRSFRRPIRFRDFGTFETEITGLDTKKIEAIELPGESKGLYLQEVASQIALPVTPISELLWSQPKQQGDFEDTVSIISLPAQNSSPRWYEQVISAVQKSAKKKWMGTTFRVACTLVLFAFLLKSFSWSSMLTALKHIHHGGLLVGVIVGTSGIVLSAYQWRSLLHSERIRFDLADLIKLYTVGIAFSHFLPTGMGGDAVKAMYVGRESGNTAGSASATVICRVTGFFSMVLIALPALFIWHQYFNSVLILWFIVLSLIVGAMIAGTIFAAILLPRFLKGKLAKNSFFLSAIRIGSALNTGLKRPRSLTVAMIFGIVFWFTAVLNCYSYAEGLGLKIPLHFYFVVVPLISLVSFLPISINGYGLRESTYVFAFSTVHVAPATALLLALLMDAQALLFGLIGGSIYLLMGRQKIAEQHE